MSLEAKVHHYQRSIEKCWEDEDRMKHCISKLYQLPITVQHLRDTGVGRTVNSLRKYDGGVGDAAKALVAKWETMVANEDSSDPKDEDEACVPDEQRHEFKSRSHSSKHDSDSSGSKSKSSKDKNRVESYVGKVSSSTESVTVNGKDSHRKRKPERSDDKMPTKKTKYSESESEEDNSRLVINSPTVSESQSPSIGTESVGSLESEAVSKKSSQLCDKPYSSRKESNGKDRKRDKEKDDLRHKSKAEVVKEIQKENKDSKKDDKRKSENHSSSKHSSKSKSSYSSSSSKDSTKQNGISEDKDKKTKKEKTSRSSENKVKDQKIMKKIKKEKDEDFVRIDSQSGISFADALEMYTLPPPTLKQGGNTLSTSTAKSIKVVPEASASESKLVPLSAKMKTNPLSLLGSNVKLEPLNMDSAATLPEMCPNYKPLLYNLNPVNRKFEEDKSLSEVMYSSKNMRTKVFSGNKTGYPTVPSLSEVSIRVLIENMDALKVTGGVPFYILKPVLERANPDQLFMLEHHNPYLIGDTDSLWQFHCNREFRTKSREEMESWREMYKRCLDEREAKLKALTASIKQSIHKSTTARSTIQFHEHSLVKPPRSVLRKQAKYGTAKDLPVTKSELKRKLISGISKSSATNSCPPAPIPRLKAASIRKKTKAPLMAKVLQLIKGRYRR